MILRNRGVSRYLADMDYVTRSMWGARPRGATTTSHPIGATKGTTLHWEGGGLGPFAHTQCASKVRSIERFHRDSRGWADIAYNLLVCPHGFVFEGRGPGVKSAANGTTQANEDWYAVCYLGGIGDPFTTKAKTGFDEAVNFLRKRGAGERVNGHRDHKATACPGDAIYKWLNSHNFDWRTPAVNKVTKFRAAIEKAIRDNPIPPERRAARAMVASIRLALSIGPKS